MIYLPFVDGLRALAIAAVVAFHAFPALLPGGFAGVDVFFVISGFLITRFIATELVAGTFSLTRFFIRRARRLLPASLVCFAIVTGLAAIVQLPDAFHYHARSLLSALLMYANIFFYRTGGYFTAPALEKPLLHTWSLSVEDQFYLTWPLLLLLIWGRLPAKSVIAVAATLCAGSLAYSAFEVNRDTELAFFLLPSRAFELLMGAMLALCANDLRMSPYAAETLATAGLVAIAASFLVLSPQSDFPGLSALPACLGTVCVIAASLCLRTQVTGVFSHPSMVSLGLISYSLYLWHWPLISLLSYRLERPLGTTEASAVVGFSILLAWVSWAYVERPFRTAHSGDMNNPGRANDRRFIMGAVTGIVALASAAGMIKIEKGFPSRYTAATRTMLDQMVSGNPRRGSCDNFQNIFANDDVCGFGRRKETSESYQVAMFGDSMADQWVPLVAEYAAEASIAGRQVTNGGCALMFGTSIPAQPASKALECARYQERARKFIDANPGLKLAVISGFWEKWLLRLETGDVSIAEPRRITPAAADEEFPRFEHALGKTISVFTERGIKVLLIGQIPTYESLPIRCIVASVSDGRDPGKCGLSTSAGRIEVGASDAALRRAAAKNPGVSFFLPSTVMCGETVCPPVMDGVMLYKNKSHINRFGAKYLRRFVTFPSMQ